MSWKWGVWEWDMSLSEDIIVEYEFDFGSEGVMYYPDGSGEPPQPSQLSLIKFFYKGQEITDLIEEMVNQKLLEQLEQDITEFEESGGGFDVEDFWDID
tara:strand:- start:6720 stop:7016 length:297 start_codon:yes stop_codon:yes gene_type:complete